MTNKIVVVAVSINVVNIGEAIAVGSVFNFIANNGKHAPIILDNEIEINKHKEIPPEIATISHQLSILDKSLAGSGAAGAFAPISLGG